MQNSSLKQSVKPIVAGILMLITSCGSAIWGIIGFIGFGASNGSITTGLGLGVIGVLAFAFGLMGGVFAIQRKSLVFSLLGTSLEVVAGIVLLFVAVTNSVSSDVFMISSMALSIPSLLAFILILQSKPEFSESGTRDSVGP